MDKFTTVEEKREMAMAVSARCNVATLAELAQYWMNEGYNIRTASQLVSWSLELAKEILVNNSKIKLSFDFINGRKYLANCGLTQASMSKRTIKKEATAIRFEMMRKEGFDPRTGDPNSWNALHNKHSIEPAPNDLTNDEEYNRAVRENKEEVQARVQQERDARLSNYKNKGFSVDSTIEEVQQRDAQQDSELDELIKQRKGE
jgi:arylamine N-acetyltransferase